MLGLACELRAQLWILCGDTDGAGGEMADAHHDAAHRHQWPGRKAELLGPEERADNDVAPCLELAVHFDDDSAPQFVQHERLLRLCQAEFPGSAGVLDAGQWRSTGAAVVAG